MNNTKELIRLIQENPDLPIVPMVDSDVVVDDYFGYWLGSFGNCEVNEYICIEMYGNDRFVTRDDQDEIEEYFIQLILDEDENISDEEVVSRAHKQAEALDWVKAIVVYIGTP